jgi:rRNA processing protein Krr1/Pno1
MPCYTVQLTTVEFKAKHSDILEKALEALSLSYSYLNNNQISIIGSYLTIDLANQKVRMARNETSLVNRIKQEYSKQAIQLAAAKNKWIVKKLADNKLALRRF